MCPKYSVYIPVCVVLSYVLYVLRHVCFLALYCNALHWTLLLPRCTCRAPWYLAPEPLNSRTALRMGGATMTQESAIATMATAPATGQERQAPKGIVDTNT